MNVKVRIEFDRSLRDWDGFGVNYVQTAQTRDYARNPQDYGGLSTLDPGKRREIIDLVFGPEGLRPGLVKMFVDPWHQASPGTPGNTIVDTDYTHEHSTQWQREFVLDGLAVTRARGATLSVLTDLYGPPGFMTLQKQCRGRDLDPSMQVELAKYVCAYAKWLRERHNVPVKYVGFHNEGECWPRWPGNGVDDPKVNSGDDYNMMWTPEMVTGFIPLVRRILDANGMHDVGVTPGETTHWTRFHLWGFADAIADSPEAVAALGLVTSHGFAGGWGEHCRWFGDWRSAGIDIIREKRPDIHAWVTSTSWSKMDAAFIWELSNHIHSAKVNGIIPWATVQNPPLWVGGDPNPGNAIQVDGKGGYEIRPGYWFFKQVCRAGQPGTRIARVRTNDSRVCPIGFCSSGSMHPDAFVLINPSSESLMTTVELSGCAGRRCELYRTSRSERYQSLGARNADAGLLQLEVPAGSVTTGFAL